MRLLSVSFDPAHDGADALRAYQARHTRSTLGWELVRPASADLPAWLDRFGVVVIADPWGGYRAGFSGSTSFKLKDFNIKKDLGPASQEVELILSVEGVRQ